MVFKQNMEKHQNNHSIYSPKTVRELVKSIKKGILPKHDLLVVAGSLYMVGEFLEQWRSLSTPQPTQIQK